jgi:hypothetical protein
MTVHAVSNPTTVEAEPVALNQRAPGYGIVTFDRQTRRITIANWPRWVDPSQPRARPYPGWPITIGQFDNGVPKAGWTLETVRTPGVSDPVVQVVEQSSGEVVYTVRIQGDSFTPHVFRDGVYTVRVLAPERGYRREYRDRRPQHRAATGGSG